MLDTHFDMLVKVHFWQVGHITFSDKLVTVHFVYKRLVEEGHISIKNVSTRNLTNYNAPLIPIWPVSTNPFFRVYAGNISIMNKCKKSFFMFLDLFEVGYNESLWSSKRPLVIYSVYFHKAV